MYWPWSCDLDLYFMLQWLWHISRQRSVSHSASSRCTDLADTLTQWPWPIFRTAVTLKHFKWTFDISSTIRPTTTKPSIVLHLNVLTWQVLDPVTLTYISCGNNFHTFYVDVRYLLNYKAYNHHTWCSWPRYLARVTLSYYIDSSIKVCFCEAVIAASVKPCILIVLNILFKHIWLGALTKISCWSDFFMILLQV